MNTDSHRFFWTTSDATWIPSLRHVLLIDYKGLSVTLPGSISRWTNLLHTLRKGCSGPQLVDSEAAMGTVALKAAQSRGSSRSGFLALLTGSAHLCAVTPAPGASRNHSLATMSDFLQEMVSQIQLAEADLVRSANFRESPVALPRFLQKPVPSPNPRAAS